ncbi:hypothetical protein NLU13_8324 [Sarocladium strictum]|uniref:HMG box domain-containing protein n=1 Tax=Sarocladium strictum TaxID=5046 RepID=A0AA39GBX9_SARSR|nr:hypothetical protein NLU13_8324 [Sarocladium strictum]
MARPMDRCLDSDEDVNDVTLFLKESSGNIMRTPKPLSKTPGRMLIPKSTVKPSTRKIRRLRDVSSQMGANPLFQKWDGDLEESPRKSPTKARQSMRKMQSSFEESDLENVLAPSTVLRARSKRPKAEKAKEDSDESDLFGGNGTPQIKVGGVTLDVSTDDLTVDEMSNAEQTDASKSALTESEAETQDEQSPRPSSSLQLSLPASPSPGEKLEVMKEETDSELMEESATSAAGDETSEYTNNTYSDFDSFESGGSVGNRTAAKLLFQKRPDLSAPKTNSSQSDETVLSEVKNMTIVEEWDEESETADLIQNMLDLQLRDSMIVAPGPAPSQEPARPATPPLSKPTEEPAVKDVPSPSKQIRIPNTPHRQSTDAFWSQEVTNDWNDKHSPTKLILPNVKKSPSKSSPSKEARKVFDATKQQIAQDFLTQLDEQITEGQIASLAESTGGVQLNWTKSLNTTAGRANWKRETIRTKLTDGTETDVRYKHHASIDLAEKVIDDEARLLNVIAHEFCHLANFMVSGITNNPHGKEFKGWAAKCSRAFADRGIKVTTKHAYEIDFKYIWECVGCGHEHKRHSRSIDPARHRCGKCKDELKQTRPVPRATAGKTTYQLFVKEQMKIVREENPGKNQKEVMKLLGEKWKARNAAAKEAEAEKKTSALAEEVAEKIVDLTMADDA